MSEVTLDTAIDDLRVTQRVVNALANNYDYHSGKDDRILTVRQVVERSQEELLRIANFGRISLKVLEDELAAHGFHLAASPTRRERVTQARIEALQASVAGLLQRIERWEKAMIDLSQRQRASQGRSLGLETEIAASRGLEWRIQKLEELAGMRPMSLKVRVLNAEALPRE